MLFAASSKLVPVSNSILTTLKPIEDVEEICLRPVTPERPVSNTRVTFCSTSSGDAFG